MSSLHILEAIAACHDCRLKEVKFPLQLNAVTRRILGKRALVLDIRVPTIELLSPESTPRGLVWAPGALVQLEKAVRGLAGEEQFYTVLRHSWKDLPVVSWQINHLDH